MNFRREVASKSGKPTQALKWISEVETATHISDVCTSASTTGNTSCDFETLDSKIAAGRFKIIAGDFARRIMNEDERQQRDCNTMLTGRQIVFNIFEHF